MSEKSVFLRWFEAQHGPRPGGRLTVKQRERLEQVAEDGERARRLLDRQNEYDARRESALYAWNVQDKHKTPYGAREILPAVRKGAKCRPSL